MGGVDHKETGGSGVCVWLTGLGGAGKSTVARELAKMIEEGGRTVTVLDVVPEIEKSPGERNSSGKLLRKAFVASRIADHGGVAICVTISSRRQDREGARELVGPDRFVEVYVDAPAAVALQRKESRNRRVKLGKRIRRGGVQLARRIGVARGRGFDIPDNPDLTLDPVSESPHEGARHIYDLLEQRGFLTTVTDRGVV